MARPPESELKRFLRRIEFGAGCHLWQGQVKRDGYGSFCFRGKSVPAHRVAHILLKGEISNGFCVLHKCDVKTCVNPDHLFLGTLVENVKDMDAKGRRGTRAKLTKHQLREVREYLSKNIRQETIALLFGVDQTTISRIKLTQLESGLI